jgi:hypothetical protein
LPILGQLVHPIREEISDARGVVNEIGNRIEHSIDVAKNSAVVGEYKSQDQILGPRTRKHSNVSPGRKRFVRAIEKTEDKDGPRNAQHRARDVCGIDPI